ncbi:MAG: hypothetical protein QOE83_942 [Actinomycetota bacterium]|jgi:hypothetical protein|nr:hypothetical protein [Actinomycetota bacterium]
MGIIAILMNQITVSREGAIDIIVVTGEIDMSNVDGLDDAVRTVARVGLTSGVEALIVEGRDPDRAVFTAHMVMSSFSPS